jgi:DNA-binding transcriptional LysR family regulator
MSTRRLIGDPLNVVVECSQAEAVSALVRHGAGAAFLPRRPAENELAGVVVRSTEPVVRRSIGLVFRPGPLTPAALAFLDAAKAGDAAAAAVSGRPAAGPSPGGTPPG